MTVREALQELVREPTVKSNLKEIEDLRKIGLPNRYIEPPEISVGHNAGIWNAAGQEISLGVSDIGKPELEVLGKGQDELVFLLSEKDDVELTGKSHKQKIKIGDVISHSMYVIVPTEFTHKQLISPGIYVLQHSWHDRSLGLMNKLNGETMQIEGLPVHAVSENEFMRMYGIYATEASGGNRVKRAFNALRK